MTSQEDVAVGGADTIGKNISLISNLRDNGKVLCPSPKRRLENSGVVVQTLDSESQNAMYECNTV